MALPARSDAALDIASFAPTLIAWQRTHGRQTLPWQQLGDSRDAYRVWLAEIMLQQTQVAAVIPYYRRFLERLPDVQALAAASLDEVMELWSGLGYYSRARNLHAAARSVVADFGGSFPRDVDALQSLPGVGRSTAGAIAAFAFGVKAPILDGNVKRVLARVFLVEGLSAGTAYMKRMWTLTEALLPDAEIERYTQGLMDLGATVCTPRNPTCLICPFEMSCIAHREGREEELPERAARKSVPQRRTAMLLVTRGRSVFVERRPAVGIWGGLWSLPEVAADASDAVMADMVARFGAVASFERTPGFVHGFTHFVLHAEIVRVTLADETPPKIESPLSSTRWVPFDAIASMGLPAPIRTLLEAIGNVRSEAAHDRFGPTRRP